LFVGSLLFYNNTSEVKKMNVTVKYSGLFSHLTGKKRETLEMAENETLGRLCDTLCGKYENLPPLNEGLIYLVNGRTAKKEQVLVEGDEIQIFQMMAGG
jgi:molybdopterin converting factor small subunit